MSAALLESVCPVCDIPADAGYFDDSSIVETPKSAAPEVVLARYELHPSYCGELQYFAQFTDAYAADPTQVVTPNLEWQIRSDGQPRAPWLTFDRIINPWGLSGFPIHLRLREGCLLELVVRFTGPAPGATTPGEPGIRSAPALITRVGGRLLGRYWYNPAFGGR
jgi:hypothetical protein